MAGFYAGTDISRLVPGEFSHNVKSRSPKSSEKPRKGAEKGLRTSFKRQLMFSRRPVTLKQKYDTHNRLTD